MNLSVTLIKPSPTLVYTPVEACKYFHTLGTICILHLSEYQLSPAAKPRISADRKTFERSHCCRLHRSLFSLLISLLLMSTPPFFCLLTPDSIESFYAFLILLTSPFCLPFLLLPNLLSPSCLIFHPLSYLLFISQHLSNFLMSFSPFFPLYLSTPRYSLCPCHMPCFNYY